MKKGLERNLFLSDFHIPDHNRAILQLIYKFIKDFKPDRLHLLGDIVNFTRAGAYEIIGEAPDLGEEINEARAIVYKLAEVARNANRKVEIIWESGNHEHRLERYLARQADSLVSIKDQYGEPLITIPHIFNLAANKIKWIPYRAKVPVGSAIVEHGDIARAKAGFTAQALIDRRGRSGFSGHTHRLAMVTRKQGDDVKFWIENGCLCNLNPTPSYTVDPDWQNSFSVAYHDIEKDILYPFPILIQENSFYWEGRVYRSGSILKE
jgi:predicted MPP superfamily phosphohydrolase